MHPILPLHAAAGARQGSVRGVSGLTTTEKAFNCLNALGSIGFACERPLARAHRLQQCTALAAPHAISAASALLQPCFSLNSRPLPLTCCPRVPVPSARLRIQRADRNYRHDASAAIGCGPDEARHQRLPHSGRLFLPRRGVYRWARDAGVSQRHYAPAIRCKPWLLLAPAPTCRMRRHGNTHIQPHAAAPCTAQGTPAWVTQPLPSSSAALQVRAWLVLQ